MAGTRRVRLRWSFAPTHERLGEPNLAAPLIDGVSEGPVIWTLHVPSGFDVGPATAAIPGSFPGHDLRRADSQLRLSTLLAEGPRGGSELIRHQLRAAQQRFYHYCRYAEYELTSSPALTGDSGPNGQALNEWLRELKEQNTQTARLRGFDKIRDEAERHSFGGSRTTEVPERAEQAGGSLLSLGERGTPTYWLTPAGRAPHIVLAPLGEREIRKKVFASLALILSILVVWLISYLPRLRVWVQALWPEQIASLGV